VKSAKARLERLERKAGCRARAHLTVVALPGGGACVPAGTLIALPGGNAVPLPDEGVEGELIALLKNFSQEGEPKPVLPDPEKEIARQRAEGRKLILVDVPYLCGQKHERDAR